MKSLCTVILSQELLPEQESYKLGRLSRSLGIPLKDRHRASGDALATVELLKILIEKDINQNIIKKSIVEFPGESISSIFRKTIEDLENTIGVFYIYNKNRKLIYVDYSKDIKNKVIKLFTSKKFIPKYVQNNFKSIKVHKTGSIDIAILKAIQEIKSLKPKINNNIDPKLFYKIVIPEIINDKKNFIITFSGKKKKKKRGKRTISQAAIAEQVKIPANEAEEPAGLASLGACRTKSTTRNTIRGLSFTI